jgi:allantoicase
MSEHGESPGPTPLDGLVDLVAERLGGRVVEANDEFFAPKENLVRPGEAVFDAERYTERGKWMDGWETRRRRTPGHDWCVLALATRGRVRRVVVDTRHFRGNHPEACSLDGSLEDGDDSWHAVLDRSPLEGDSPNSFFVDDDRVFSRLRLNIFPDGGVARLRVFGEPRPDWSAIAAAGEPVDLASALNGGAPLACSDRFFSDPRNLLMPGSSTYMGDGWETRRRRGPGHDWVVIRLGHPGVIEEVAVATTHFKGNFPATCALEGCDFGTISTATDGGEGGPAGEPWEAAPWHELVPRSALGPDTEHQFAPVAGASGARVSHVRFSIYPDGGVARLRLRGRPVP